MVCGRLGPFTHVVAHWWFHGLLAWGLPLMVKGGGRKEEEGEVTVWCDFAMNRKSTRIKH